MSRKKVIKLLDKYLHGHSSETERQKVEAWLERMDSRNTEWSGLSEENRDAYIRYLFEDLQNKLTEKYYQHKRPTRRLIFSTAAAILLLGAGAWLLYKTMIRPAEKVNMNSLITESTHIGEMKTVILNDSTRVWLNAMSTLQYPPRFSKDKREVYLKGEAFFEVAKDAGQPFIVHSEALSTKVLGTSFNIMAYPDDKNIEIDVFSGKIDVNETDKKDHNLTPLAKDEKIIYTKNNRIMVKGILKNNSGYPVWKEGELAFDHTNMNEVAKILYRTYGVIIHFNDTSIAGYEITGHFKTAMGSDNLLKAICLSFDGRFTREGNQVMVMDNN